MAFGKVYNSALIPSGLELLSLLISASLTFAISTLAIVHLRLLFSHFCLFNSIIDSVNVVSIVQESLSATLQPHHQRLSRSVRCVEPLPTATQQLLRYLHPESILRNGTRRLQQELRFIIERRQLRLFFSISDHMTPPLPYRGNA